MGIRSRAEHLGLGFVWDISGLLPRGRGFYRYKDCMGTSLQIFKNRMDSKGIRG